MALFPWKITGKKKQLTLIFSFPFNMCAQWPASTFHLYRERGIEDTILLGVSKQINHGEFNNEANLEIRELTLLGLF